MTAWEYIKLAGVAIAAILTWIAVVTFALSIMLTPLAIVGYVVFWIVRRM